MPTAPYSQGSAVRWTRELETTEGEVVGSTRTDVILNKGTAAAGGSSVKSGRNTGAGGTVCIRPELRFGTFVAESELTWGLNHLEFEDQLRNTFPAIATATVAATWDNAGTRGDGDTGPVITGIANDFDNLIGREGAMLVTTDPGPSGVTAANLLARRIDFVWADGSQIDLAPAYVTGSADIALPLVSEGPLSAVFNCGQDLTDQAVAGLRSVNFEGDFTDQPGGSFEMVRGAKGSRFEISISGKGNIGVTFNYEAMDYDALAETTQGTGTPTANPYALDCQMTGGDDVVALWYGATLDLGADDIVTSLTITADGGASGVDGTLGQVARAGVTAEDINVSCAIDFLHKHIQSKVIVAAGRAGTLAGLDLKVRAPSGAYYWILLSSILFEPNLPEAAEKAGLSSNSVGAEGALGSTTGTGGVVVDHRQIHIQAFAAP